jgi:cytochrome c oxidase cbb3-type subunit 2
MSRSSHLFTGIFGAFAVSCVTLVCIPQLQIGGLAPYFDEENNEYYPLVNLRQGSTIYIREGCYYCHSQQVRDSQNGTDLDRGWGSRRTVARDYLYGSPAILGSIRLGPDLANIGAKDWRNESADETVKKPARRDARWHLTHLYHPTAVVAQSNMPPYRYLFTKRKISGQRSADAIDVDTDPGYEIVPNSEAKQLVAYLLSLDRTFPLPETKPETAPAAASPAPAAAAAPAAPAAPGPAATAPVPAPTTTPPAPAAPAPAAAPAGPSK